MYKFFKYKSSLPRLDDFPLESYTCNFSIEKLTIGIDNIRYDVYLSPVFCKATVRIVSHLMARYTRTEELGKHDRSKSWAKEIDKYKRLYKDIMLDAVNKAKEQRKVQIDFLAQTAIIKMIIQEINNQFEILISRARTAVKKSDLSHHQDQKEAPKLKQRLSQILQDKELITRQVGGELFGHMLDVQQRELREIREANFGAPSVFVDDILANPILHVDNPFNDFFMLEVYDLSLGRRMEDPDKYDTLLFLIKRLLNQIDRNNLADKGLSVDRRGAVSSSKSHPSQPALIINENIEPKLRQVDNVDILFNYQNSQKKFKILKKQKANKGKLKKIKTLAANQKQVLNYFYRNFNRNGLIARLAAAYEMQTIYRKYCPPLVPQQVLQYLIIPKTRKAVKNRLKRLKKMYGKSFSFKPMQRKIKRVKMLMVREKKEYLIRFLKAFFRYHRDQINFDIMKEAMDRVHLINEDKFLNLSRENNLLYEFLLPHEQVLGKKPIINHMIIKADVRGSTDITYQLNNRGLNPASYFSLNFFDPISELLSDYDAGKIFIEGDAIILSIFERQKTPAGWYSVARACGIAINMLIIIQRYNTKSHRYQLPILELGIGLVYKDKPPTFLFDGDKRIMISPAINLADRLSGCSRFVRKIITENKSPFNLYVFQTSPEAEVAATKDDISARYNVNGIELNPAGFNKLSTEIDLKQIKGDFPDLLGKKATLYTGKFPTLSGKYQRLVIREARIPVADPENLHILRFTRRKYYEICTNPGLYKYARSIS